MSSDDANPVPGLTILASRVAPSSIPIGIEGNNPIAPSPWLHAAAFAATTDAGGIATLVGLPPGSYFLWPSRHDMVLDGPSPIQVHMGQRSTVESRCARVYGIVIEHDGTLLRACLTSPEQRPLGSHPSTLAMCAGQVARRLSAPVDRIRMVLVGKKLVREDVPGTLAWESRDRTQSTKEVSMQCVDQIRTPVVIEAADLAGVDRTIRLTFHLDGETDDFIRTCGFRLVRPGTSPADPGYVFPFLVGEPFRALPGKYVLTALEPSVFRALDLATRSLDLDADSDITLRYRTHLAIQEVLPTLLGQPFAGEMMVLVRTPQSRTRIHLHVRQEA